MREHATLHSGGKAAAKLSSVLPSVIDSINNKRQSGEGIRLLLESLFSLWSFAHASSSINWNYEQLYADFLMFDV
jgi:hypothetical protein